MRSRQPEFDSTESPDAPIAMISLAWSGNGMRDAAK
jgi:hypothetical protein